MMKRLRILSLSAVLLAVSLWADGRTSTVTVKTQKDMDGAPAAVSAALKQGYDRVEVIFSPGTYIYPEAHFSFFDIKAPSAELTFKGNGAVLKGAGRFYVNGDRFTEEYKAESGVVSTTDVDSWSNVFQADRKVELVDKKAGLYRIHSRELPLSAKCGPESYILVTEWFKSSIYKVDSVRKGYVYFKADDLDLLNYDYSYGKVYPRFKLSCASVGSQAFRIYRGRVVLKGVKQVWLTTTGRCFHMRRCSLKSVTISGFTFLGNSNNGPELFDFTDNNLGSLRVEGNTFDGIRSTVMCAYKTDNVTFSGNTLRNCYQHGFFESLSHNIVVSGNTFSSCGKAMTNSMCVKCSGQDYLVTGNTFVDFGYCGIAVGVWYKSDMSVPSRGEVSANTLRYSDQYFRNYREYTIMDSGAIYVYTQNERALIKDNTIVNYVGIKDNRGIFLDDGACNVTVTGNTVRNTPNSWSIDSRRVKSVETEAGSRVKAANVGNIIKDNIVDGKIRFEQR